MFLPSFRKSQYSQLSASLVQWPAQSDRPRHFMVLRFQTCDILPHLATEPGKTFHGESTSSNTLHLHCGRGGIRYTKCTVGALKTVHRCQCTVDAVGKGTRFCRRLPSERPAHPSRQRHGPAPSCSISCAYLSILSSGMSFLNVSTLSHDSLSNLSRSDSHLQSGRLKAFTC